MWFLNPGQEEPAVSSANPTSWTVADYERAAEEYLRALPPEHFMEATPQATQREITLESLALVRGRRSDVQVFNELLVQYPLNGGLEQVVPDNMVVLSPEPVRTRTSYNLPFEPAHPLCVLDYVSPSSKRKDYSDNFRKYEHGLKVPYHLLFDPAAQKLRLCRHTGVTYAEVAANTAGRFPLAELELELGLLNGWARFWFRGELLLLPAELQQKFDALRQQLQEARELAGRERRRADQEKQRADRAAQFADQEKLRAENQTQRSQPEELLADQEKLRADQEKQKRVTAEAEVERLRALLAQLQGWGPEGGQPVNG